jgi:hypothetical protein
MGVNAVGLSIRRIASFAFLSGGRFYPIDFYTVFSAVAGREYTRKTIANRRFYMFLSEELVKYVHDNVENGQLVKDISHGEFAKGAIMICLDRIPKTQTSNVAQKIKEEVKRCHNAWNSACLTLRKEGNEVLCENGFKNEFIRSFKSINDELKIFE